MKPVHIKSGYRNKLDVHTAIVPGKTAAGLFVGDPITVLPEPTGTMRTTLGDNVELIDYGPVRIWIRNGAIEQIGVLSGYTGYVSGTSIGIGSSIRQVIKILGGQSSRMKRTTLSFHNYRVFASNQRPGVALLEMRR
jgi:hypothetical protein